MTSTIPDLITELNRIYADASVKDLFKADKYRLAIEGCSGLTEREKGYFVWIQSELGNSLMSSERLYVEELIEHLDSE